MPTNETDCEEFTLFFELALQIYTSFLLVVGLPGNAISGFIMATDRTNRVTTRILMAILAAADTAVLLTAVTRYWAFEVLNNDFRNYSDLMCKIHVFAVAFFTDFAVGSLCAIAVERFLVVAFPQRVNVVTSTKTVSIGMTGFAAALFVKNGIHFFIMRLREMPTEAGLIARVCAPDEDYTQWIKAFMKIDFFSFAVLPYVILFSCNLYIYCVLKRQRRLLQATLNKNSSKTDRFLSHGSSASPTTNMTGDVLENNEKNSELIVNYKLKRQKNSLSVSGHSKSARRKRKPEDVIKILTALTVVHVVCTLPGTIFTLLSDYTDLRRQKQTKHVLVMLIFTNNAINFFAYLVSSERFRKKFVNYLCRCWRNRQRR